MQIWKKMIILAVVGLMLVGVAVVIIAAPNVAWNSGIASTVPVAPSPNAAWNTGVSNFDFPIVHPNVAWNS